METSRDDFVIAIRSAFLKKETKQRFSLLGLILFSIIFIILGNLNFKAINYVKVGIKEIVYRSSFIVSGPENFLKRNYIDIKNHLNLFESYKKNKRELKLLRSKNLTNNFIILENKRLKNIIDDYLVDSEETVAKVLSDKKSPFLKSIIVNKGTKHGLKIGMAVLNENYLVGKIVEVNYLSSRILLLSDINSKVPVIIEPGGLLSILSGNGKENGKIQYLKNKSEIMENSIVYTSGSAGLFKTGIPIGKLRKQKAEESLDGVIKDEKILDFFSDFSQLSFVKIKSFERASIK